MNILILFGSIEGQTKKIARFIADHLDGEGQHVRLVDTDTVSEISFDGVDGVILAASVHERRHPKNFEATLVAQAQALAKRKTLMISVSLNAAFADGCAEAREYLTEMKMRTGLKPDHEMLVAGAVRSGSYDYFATQVIQHVVLRDHPEAAKGGPHEFTDWKAIRSGVAQFLGGMK